MDAQKQAADFFIDYNFKPKQLPVGKIEWCYGLKSQEEMKVAPTYLCPKTLRLKSKYGQKKWEQWLEQQIHLPIDELFKGRKYFEEFLMKYKKLPNKDELLIFYYNRYVMSKKKTTLPKLIEDWSVQFIE